MEKVDWKPVRRLWELCSLLTHLPTSLKSTGTTGISCRASLKQKNCEERLTPSIQRTRMLTGCPGQSKHLLEFTGDVDADPAGGKGQPESYCDTPLNMGGGKQVRQTAFGMK